MEVNVAVKQKHKLTSMKLTTTRPITLTNARTLGSKVIKMKGHDHEYHTHMVQHYQS